MRRFAGVIVGILVLGSLARAADTPTPEQQKKMYDDALAQLHAAQDRKNELAKENEDLKAKIEELNKQLAATQSQVRDLKRDVADNAAKDYFLRAYHTAFQAFLQRDPALNRKWDLFIQNDLGANLPSVPAVLDPSWLGDAEPPAISPSPPSPPTQPSTPTP